jgi:hypothetical protein
LDVSEASLRELLARGRNRRDVDGSVIEDLGFDLGAWNGGSGGGDCGFDFSCGSYASTPAVWIANSWVLSLPYEGEASNRLLTIPALLKIVEGMARSLEPDWGVVMSHLYQDMIPDGEPGAPIVGWLTYLNVPEKALPVLPAGVRVVPVPERGSVIVVTEERFTATNPCHVQTADAVARALAEFGLLRRTA